MSYVYKMAERGRGALENLYTVGHYTPAGVWVSESDHDGPDSSETAAQRVHYLNGGSSLDLGVRPRPDAGRTPDAPELRFEILEGPGRSRTRADAAPALTSASEQAQINAVTEAAVNVVEASLERVRVQKQAAEASYHCPDCGEPGERLVAAAPDLLAVCTEIEEHGTDDWEARMLTLRAAIAKATPLQRSTKGAPNA